MRLGIAAVVAMLAIIGCVGAPQALAGSARLSVIARTDPSIVAPNGSPSMRIIISNLGDEPVVAGTTNRS